MRQLFQIDGLLFVMFPDRNQVWMFNQFQYIGCLTFPEVMQVARQIKGGDRNG